MHAHEVARQAEAASTSGQRDLLAALYKAAPSEELREWILQVGYILGHYDLEQE